MQWKLPTSGSIAVEVKSLIELSLHWILLNVKFLQFQCPSRIQIQILELLLRPQLPFMEWASFYCWRGCSWLQRRCLPPCCPLRSCSCWVTPRLPSSLFRSSVVQHVHLQETLPLLSCSSWKGCSCSWQRADLNLSEKQATENGLSSQLKMRANGGRTMFETQIPQ